MKIKIKILFLLCAVTANLAAQTNEETKTIFGNGKPHLGYFVSPFGQFGKIAGSTAVLPGLGAGVIFNNKFSLGVTYKFIATENTPVGEEETRLYLDQFYAGIKAEYSIFPTKPVHLNFQLEAGMGHTELDLKNSYEFDHVGFPISGASFAYAEPGLALEINLWKYLKFDIGAGYRFTSDVVFRSVSEKDLRGVVFAAGLKVGLF
jgi:hypothetical protein